MPVNEEHELVIIDRPPYTVIVSQYPRPCDYVRIERMGKEVVVWNSDEWRDDPEAVMGAIMGAINGIVKGLDIYPLEY